jgi:D-sedoheptulose 7-phosphate isomerase
VSESSTTAIAQGYLDEVRKIIDSIDLSLLDEVVACLRSARDRGSNVFVMGNGGSAATASHLATDVGKSTKAPGRKPVRIVSLNDNASWVTALGNDEGYGNVFSGQLDNLVSADDLVIAISASGNSENILRAVELAKSRGAVTIGIVGFDGGALSQAVDLNVHAPTRIGSYGPAEDVHMMIQHIITECLKGS